MKPTSIVRKLLVGTAGVSLLVGTAMAGERPAHVKRDGRNHYVQVAAPIPHKRTVLVYVTGSRIPQQVVIEGQQVTTGYPLWVLQGDELNRNGATTVAGMLSMDPNITFSRRTH